MFFFQKSGDQWPSHILLNISDERWSFFDWAGGQGLKSKLQKSSEA